MGSVGRRVLAAVVAAGLLAAACGNTDDGGDAATDTTAADGDTATSAAGGGDYSENVPVDAPGVSDTEIRVGSIVSATNPTGGDQVLLNDGIEAYFDLVNAQGGIYGRELVLASERDDMMGNNETEVVALLTQDDVYAAFVASLLFTGASQLAEAGIPTFGWNIQAEWAGPENFFPNLAPVCFEGCPLLPHILPWLVRETDSHRVAVMGYNVPQSASCVQGNVDNLERFGSDVDAEVVFTDGSIAYGQIDYAPQVTEMKDKDVDFLVTCMDFNGDLAIAEEMNKQGIRDDVAFYHANLYNHDFVRDNADALEGDIVLAQITAVEHEPPPPGVQEYLDYAAEHDLKVTELTMQGWIAARQLVDALKATGPEFTWENLVGAWNQQTWYTAEGFVLPIDWTRQHTDPAEGTEFRSEFECGNFVRVEDGELVSAFAEGDEPWVCFDGHRPEEWHEPVNVSFAGEPFELADAMDDAQG